MIKMTLTIKHFTIITAAFEENGCQGVKLKQNSNHYCKIVTDKSYNIINILQIQKSQIYLYYCHPSVEGSYFYEASVKFYILMDAKKFCSEICGFKIDSTKI